MSKYIKKTTGSSFQKIRFGSADFETIVINGEHIPFMVTWTIDGINIKSKSIWDYTNIINEQTILRYEVEIVKDLILETQKLKNKHHMYLHNMGNFDGIILFRNILKLDEYKKLLTKPIIKNNSFYELKINKIKFRDSYKLLPLSLKKLAIDMIGEDKIDINIGDGFSINNLNNKKKREEILKYCENDTLILWKIMNEFKKTTTKIWPEINPIQNITTTKMALKILKRYYMENDTISNSSKFYNHIKNTLRESYKGGITEVYKPYGSNLLYYDINSAYPAAMMNFLPTGEPKTVDLSTIDDYYKWINKFFGFVVVKVRVNKTYIPFMGINDRDTNKNIYPYGEFTTTIFSEELKYAMEINDVEIIKIFKAIEFKKEKPLKNFSKTIYNLRLKAKNKSEKLIYKMMLNSLYGRMGMKEDIEEILIVDTVTLNKLETISYVGYISIKLLFTDTKSHIIEMSIKKELKNKITYIKQKILIEKILIELTRKPNIKIFNSETAIQIASAITAYARINIDKYKREIIKKGGNIYYSDTDSVITDTEIKTSEKLGGMKLEKKIEEGYFMAPKAYALRINDKWEIKIKGINETSINQSKNDILNMFKKNMINEEWNDITNKKPIKKNFKNMKLKYESKKQKISLEIDKRIKTFNKKIWIDTEPLEYIEKYGFKTRKMGNINNIRANYK